MKDNYEQSVQKQFGSFCIKVLRNEAAYLQRSAAAKRKHEVSLDYQQLYALEKTPIWDHYFMDDYVFYVCELPVIVTGRTLADAIARLPKHKQSIILLSYFLGMNDREISELTHDLRQTVRSRRHSSLNDLRKYLLQEGYER